MHVRHQSPRRSAGIPALALIVWTQAWLLCALPPGVAAAGSIHAAPVSLDAVFKQLDWDGDGFLSEAEVAPAMPRKDHRPLDLNADGRISREEYSASFHRVGDRTLANQFQATEWMLNQALGQLRQGNVQTAVAMLRVLTARAPFHPGTHVGLAGALRRAGRWDEARARLERALEIAPGISEAWLELAMLEDHAGDFPACEAALGKAVLVMRAEFDHPEFRTRSRLSQVQSELLATVVYLLERKRPRPADALLRHAVELFGPGALLEPALEGLQAVMGPLGRLTRPN